MNGAERSAGVGFRAVVRLREYTQLVTSCACIHDENELCKLAQYARYRSPVHEHARPIAPV